LQRKKFIDFQVVRVRNGRVGHDPSCERSKLSLKISDRRVSAHKIDGTRLWRIDLGRNIRAGAHYTQFIVYDLDGDGRAEVACKTADGTVDGLGTVIGDATKDYRSLTVPIDGIQVLATNDARYGKILAGPEYLDWNTSSLVRLLTATGAAANNGTKANAALTADLCGDWREEVIWRAADNTSLRIYSTTIPATNRIYTLMHDPQYRLAIAWQNVGYNQPPHPSFYLGEGMSDPPRPRIVHRDTEAPAFKTLTPSATRRPARRGSDSADHRCLERPSG